MSTHFRIAKKSRVHRGRTGVLHTAHGKIPTPFFMPIATKAAVKTVSTEELKACGADILLSNTYHLFLRPGHVRVKKLGGLHRFMRWDGPILTDSGGYQVFSLARMRKITPRGAEFRSHLDGKKHLLTPALALKIQEALGSDILMVLDECVEYPAKRAYLHESVELTTKWAKLSKKAHTGRGLLFAIVQGGVYKDLRVKSAQELVDIGFDGYAIGGLAVGEPREKMYDVLEWVMPKLPENVPHYLMGVGQPEEIVEAVKHGVDMFDCVLPTRNARHGLAYTGLNKKILVQKLKSQNSKGKSASQKSKLYATIRITNNKHALDKKPLDEACDCLACRGGYSRAYLRHLFLSADPLGQRLLTIHNVRFYLRLMEEIRKDI